MFQKLRTIIYHVDDLAKAKQWYNAITGIDPYFESPFYIGFDINGCELGLDSDSSNVTAGNSTVAYWKVEDIQRAVDKCMVAGGILFSAIQKVGGTIQVAIIQDPFGNHVGLISE